MNEQEPLVILSLILSLYDRCDTIGLDGKPVPPNTPRGSFTCAQKLRASMTYAFGRIYGIGSQVWQRSNANGKVTKIGNPSISEEVSRYLISLRRRKVCANLPSSLFHAPSILFRHKLARRLPVHGQSLQ